MIGEPKINLEALKARLRGAVDQSLTKADAQVKAEVVHPVLPTTEKKSKPRNDESGKNGKRELSEGELVRLKKQGEEYIKTTQEAIAGARDMTELMELVRDVASTKKEGKMQLSLKLPNGLPALLSKDKDFSGKFNVLLDRWGERVTAILFDDADGIPRFKAFMKGVILDSPNISRAKFFDMYLERSSLSKLGGVSNVIKKMKEIWDQYFPEVKVKEKETLKKEKATMHKEEQKSPEDTFSALVKALGKRQDPFKNDDTEVIIESISPEEIALKYRNNTGGQWIPGKIRVAQAIGFAKNLEKNFGFRLRKRKDSSAKREVVSKKHTSVEHKQEADAETILKNIEATLDQQPQSVQDMFRSHDQGTNHIPFQFVREIQGKQYIFTTISGNEVALVQNDKDKNRYKLRFFRFSGSDHQWKAIPGSRGNDEFMKGEENNPLHHYVQSAKLHKDMYRVLNELPQGDLPFSLFEYLPIPENKARHMSGKYADEFEFKEEYLALKNKNWKDFQDFAQQFYKMYIEVVASADSFRNFTLQGKFYRLLSDEKNIHPALKVIKEYLEQINADPKYRDKLSKTSLRSLQFSDEDRLREIPEIFHKNFSAYIEEGFDASFPESMLPDFSLAHRRDSYEKPDVEVAGDTINIEEYAVESSEGDSLVFAMAYDSKGRVYIDNIYDPRVGMNDYGTLEKICQMGHLVYKPEDYKFQAGPGFPEGYLGEKNGQYVEINKLWEKLAPVKRFKEELIRRGVLKMHSEDSSRVSSSATITEEKKPKERAYEELVESIAKAEKKQYASVISEGLAPFVEYVKTNPTATLQSLIEHENYGGIEKVAQALSPILQNILPRSWSESERQQFALEFTIQEIKDSF